ncbi:MAG TPA: carboxypeptidase-like regulatory domain-containing protein [Thermoanaerobaculia bacterium]|nr:carboxypeptidase-like regulatory domain-containing protein [Thermoanaerobaculia bacterium]
MNPRWRTILLLACLAGSSGVLAAPPGGGATITGTLVDEQGRSMAAIGPVEVEVVRSPATSLGRAAVEADGRLVLTHIPAGFAELRIRRPGAAPFRRPAVRVPKSGTVDLGRILLPRGETLTVEVTDPEERPLVGVELWVKVSDKALDPAWQGRPAAVTGADGQAILQGLSPEQKLEVDFCRVGWISGYAELAAGPEEAYQMTLSPAVHLTGTVVGPDGAPVAGATVWERRNGTPYLRAGEYASFPGRGCPDGGWDPATDSEGRFTLSHLTPGWYQIEVRHKGFVSKTLQAVEIPEAGRSGLSISLQRDAQKVEPDEPVQQAKPDDHISACVVTPPDWEIAPGSEVSGKLLGLEPAEIPWVRVAATAPCGREYPVEGFVTPDGNYHIGPLPKGEWTLQAWVGERDARRTIDLKPEDRELVADLEFPRLTEVSGLVKGPDGKPAPYASVSFKKEGAWTQWATARTDGRFEILLEDGTYQMATHTHGFGIEEPPRQVVVAGQPVTGLEFRIPGAATLHGHVLGLEPGEIPWVDVEGPDGTYQLTAESDGTFDFPGLYPGIWGVTINTVRFSGTREEIDREITVHAGETDLSLDVRYPTEPAPAAPGGSR